MSHSVVKDVEKFDYFWINLRACAHRADGMPRKSEL